MTESEISAKLALIDAKLDLILVAMPKLKTQIKKQNADPMGDTLRVKYRRAIMKLYRVPAQESPEEQLVFNDQLREEISKHINQQIPEKHQTWLGRIFSSEGFGSGIIKKDGKSRRGYYVAYNS